MDRWSSSGAEKTIWVSKAGSVVGTLDTDGELRRLRTIDRRYEGVHASVDTGVMDFLPCATRTIPAGRRRC